MEMGTESVEEVEDEEDPAAEMTDLDEEEKEMEVTARHPIEHDPAVDNPTANAPARMGEDEWVEIGPGSFDDSRDPAGKAASKKTKK